MVKYNIEVKTGMETWTKLPISFDEPPPATYSQDDFLNKREEIEKAWRKVLGVGAIFRWVRVEA